MVQVTYPGVYIQEVSSGVHTITGVSTSITAFIDFFKEGPSNRAVEIFGMTDFERVFGGLDDRSEASYAIAQFFLNGGGTALVVRVAAETRSSPLVASDKPFEKARAAAKMGTAGGATAILDLSAASEGIWGNNLRVDIDLNTADSSKLFNLTVTRYSGPTGKATPVASERYLNLAVDAANPRYVEAVINDQSKLIRVKHLAAGGADADKLPMPTGTIGGDLTVPSLTQAQLNGFSGAKIHVKIGTGADTDAIATLDTWSTTAGSEAVKSLRDLRPRLEKAIRGSVPPAGAALRSPASFAGAVVELIRDAAGVDRQFRVLSGRTGETYAASELVVLSNEAADATATTLKLTGAPTSNVQEYAFGQWSGVPPAPADIGALKLGVAGGDGLEPGATEIIGTQGVEPHTGIYALDYVDLFNILCIPRAADLADTAMVAVVSKALKYCEDRRAFMIVDIPPSINEVQEIKDWLDAHAGLRNNNAALYFPRPKIPDPRNEFRLRSVGASGTMAGIYARTDSARGVWKAPAGIEAGLSGVADLDAKLTDAQNGTLNPLGINCLRSFPIYGGIAWGARTLNGADQIGSEWKYIPIRRLALFLEESLFRGTKWVVFEPNDEPLWAKIRLNVGAFMTAQFRQGAFQGTNPKDAFFVKCDAETTTQDDRNKGIVNILVGFAPLKPAEFVVISIQQIAGNL
jgi:phage tail sheath protein FI